jgi:hypothetical protein
MRLLLILAALAGLCWPSPASAQTGKPGQYKGCYQICDKAGCHLVCPDVNPAQFGELWRLQLERESLLRQGFFPGSQFPVERLSRLEGQIEVLIALLSVRGGGCPGCGGGCNPFFPPLTPSPFVGGGGSFEGLGGSFPIVGQGPCPGGICGPTPAPGGGIMGTPPRGLSPSPPPGLQPSPWQQQQAPQGTGQRPPGVISYSILRK